MKKWVCTTWLPNTSEHVVPSAWHGKMHGAGRTSTCKLRPEIHSPSNELIKFNHSTVHTFTETIDTQSHSAGRCTPLLILEGESIYFSSADVEAAFDVKCEVEVVAACGAAVQLELVLRGGEVLGHHASDVVGLHDGALHIDQRAEVDHVAVRWRGPHVHDNVPVHTIDGTVLEPHVKAVELPVPIPLAGRDDMEVGGANTALAPVKRRTLLADVKPDLGQPADAREVEIPADARIGVVDQSGLHACLVGGSHRRTQESELLAARGLDVEPVVGKPLRTLREVLGGGLDVELDGGLGGGLDGDDGLGGGLDGIGRSTTPCRCACALGHWKV